jgi:hypothetical protein
LECLVVHGTPGALQGQSRSTKKKCLKASFSYFLPSIMLVYVIGMLYMMLYMFLSIINSLIGLDYVESVCVPGCVELFFEVTDFYKSNICLQCGRTANSSLPHHHLVGRHHHAFHPT